MPAPRARSSDLWTVGGLWITPWPTEAAGRSVSALLAEGRNVSLIAVHKTVQGIASPDMFVDGRLCEIKTSTASNIDAFTERIVEVFRLQGAAHVFVNATRSGILRYQFTRAMQSIIELGKSAYIRVIGPDYSDEFGEW